MALFDDLMKNNMTTGLAIAVGMTVLGPIILPAAARIAKPVAKSVIKAGIVAFEKGRETLAELGEVTEDIFAEARAELAQEAAQAAKATGGGTSQGDD